MNVLTPIGNQAFINWIQGLVLLFVVIYKFTNVVYNYFNKKENGYPPLQSSYDGVEIKLNSSCLKFPDKICIELIKVDRDKPCEKCIMKQIWEGLVKDETKV